MDPEELDNDSASDEEPEVPQEEKDAQLFEAAKNGEMKLVTQALADFFK